MDASWSGSASGFLINLYRNGAQYTSGSIAGTSTIYGGLPPGSYYLTVQALGDSGAADSATVRSNTVTLTSTKILASNPAGLRATSSGTTLSATWSHGSNAAAASAEGSAITYLVESQISTDGGRTWAASNATFVGYPSSSVSFNDGDTRGGGLFRIRVRSSVSSTTSSYTSNPSWAISNTVRIS